MNAASPVRGLGGQLDVLAGRLALERLVGDVVLLLLDADVGVAADEGGVPAMNLWRWICSARTGTRAKPIARTITATIATAVERGRIGWLLPSRYAAFPDTLRGPLDIARAVSWRKLKLMWSFWTAFEHEFDENALKCARNSHRFRPKCARNRPGLTTLNRVFPENLG